MLNGSYTNQQFLDFMLVATLKKADSERQTAGVFTVSIYLYMLIELCMCILTPCILTVNGLVIVYDDLFIKYLLVKVGGTDLFSVADKFYVQSPTHYKGVHVLHKVSPLVNLAILETN